MYVLISVEKYYEGFIVLGFRNVTLINFQI